ncbi:ABC transporter ATP-binding protein [Parapedobacter lycopersici]|uniref:ABC transporter ATP-binding protein n=1 Tax=Parapedobacter lycopersici TaxID=1864939 RepID=UPI00214D74A7|nr:ATP-binding cassette domain-containing protein [Parapedobacter lycopersici]
MHALTISRLSKRYGYKTVLDIPAHQFCEGVTWIQGRNGSGKSTLLKIMAGLLAYEGDVILGGLNLRKQPMAYRRRIAFAESEPRFPAFMTGLDLVGLFMRAKRGNTARKQKFIAEFGMADYLSFPVQEYSAGMVKKLSLLLAFLDDSHYILLDEPCITLDEQAINSLSLWVEERRLQGTSFVLTSHQAFPPGISIQEQWLLLDGGLHPAAAL